MTRFTNIITLNHGGRCFCEMFELNATSSPSVDNSNLSDGYAAAAPGLMNSLKGIQHLSAESLDIYEELEIFRRGLASVRFVSIRDGGADEREAWLLEAFPEPVERGLDALDIAEVGTDGDDHGLAPTVPRPSARASFGCWPQVRKR